MKKIRPIFISSVASTTLVLLVGLHSSTALAEAVTDPTIAPSQTGDSSLVVPSEATPVADPIAPPPAEPSTDTTLQNNLDSTAQTGDAGVIDNYQAGDATTGDSSAIANVINTISTSTVPDNFSVFTTTINGDVGNSLIIDPTLLTGSSTLNPTSLSTQTNSTIENNLTLLAGTGNASVTGNGSAGNATSGDALAQANIINLINSLISSNQSFLGIINVMGNLNGNIYLPANLVNGLVPVGSPVGSLSQITNQTINNQVTATATSGDASVTGNGTAGDATTGNASTNVKIYNMAGSQINGGNVLLVFVNVMGRWVGLLLDAPAGTTSAALGSQITSSTLAQLDQIETSNQLTINNNVSVTAVSGNATVANNCIGGNATTGNATANVNILNLTGSQVSASNWFGILFINIMGDWNGSLCVLLPEAPAANNTSVSATAELTVASLRKAISQRQYYTVFSFGDDQTNDPAPSPQVLGSEVKQVGNPFKDLASATPKVQKDWMNLIISGAVVSFGLSLFGVERIMAGRRQN